MCYTYDNLSRVTSRTVKSLADNSVISTETYTYDAAGNLTDAPDSCFQYDNNNRLVVFNGNTVTYDMDGNMTSDGVCPYSYDSANRLISHGGHTYTYNAEDVRIRNLCTEEDTTYTYNTNCKLSQLLTKTTGNVVTIATSKIAVTLDNRSKRWYNMSQGDEKNGQNAAQCEAESSC